MFSSPHPLDFNMLVIYILIWGRSGTQYDAMVTELLSSYCGEHLVESYCKKSKISDTNWLRYLFIIFEQNLVECMTSSLG